MNASRNSTPTSPAGAIYTYPELVFCAVGFFVMAVVAITGNTLVLVAIARNKILRNVTNVFVVNLSICDSLTGFACLWSVPGMVSTTPGYPWSNVPCVAAATLAFITVGCSMYTMAIIALTRCILITRSKKTYQWLYTSRKIALVIIGSWLAPLCAIVVPPLSGTGDMGFDPSSRTCTDVETHPRAASYDKIQVTTFYPLPLVVIVVSYVIIWRHVRRHFKQRLQADIRLQSSTVTPFSLSASNLDNAGSVASISATPAESLTHAQHTRHLGRMKNDQLTITKNLFVVVFAYLVCFTPFFLTVITNSSRYQLYGAMILLLNICINPFIYAAKHPHFRPVLRSMLPCRLSKN